MASRVSDVEDVEATASVHQHLGEVLLADDGVDDERVVSRSSDVGRVAPLIKGDRRFQPVKEGGDGRLDDACLSIAHFVLVLGVDGIISPKDHEAFLRIGKAIPIVARCASYLGRCLLALSFFQSAGLSQKTLEEFTVLVEVLDRVGVVGTWALHKLVEVVRLALLAKVELVGRR